MSLNARIGKSVGKGLQVCFARSPVTFVGCRSHDLQFFSTLSSLLISLISFFIDTLQSSRSTFAASSLRSSCHPPPSCAQTVETGALQVCRFQAALQKTRDVSSSACVDCTRTKPGCRIHVICLNPAKSGQNRGPPGQVFSQLTALCLSPLFCPAS